MSKRVQKVLLLLLSGLLLTLPGWGAQSLSVQAAASPACGSGDHGLLQELQKQSGSESSPIRFSDVQFLNGETGRAAGNGFLIGTSNGGCNFQEIYHGQWSFKQIEFPNNVHGWALASVQEGQAVYLIATADGGSHWKRISKDAVNFEKIDFLDNQNGFGYKRASTYYTKDGGVSWSIIKTPANTRGAYFSSRAKGWAVVVEPGAGYRVMKTTDGGKSWSLSVKASFQDPVYGQIYASGSQVWAVLYGGSGMSQTSYSLYASSNNGGDWKRVIAEETAGGGPAPGSGAALLKSGPASGRPGNMQLIGNTAAFLVGYSPAGEKVAVGRSYNGGRTWTNLPAVPGYEGEISFTSDKQGWLAVGEFNSAALYYTPDGGKTWKKKLSFLNPENQ